MSGEYGLASVPEYEARTEDRQSSEMQLTVGTLFVYCRGEFYCVVKIDLANI